MSRYDAPSRTLLASACAVLAALAAGCSQNLTRSEAARLISQADFMKRSVTSEYRVGEDCSAVVVVGRDYLKVGDKAGITSTTEQRFSNDDYVGGRVPSVCQTPANDRFVTDFVYMRSVLTTQAIAAG